jgi:actin-related protein
MRLSTEGHPIMLAEPSFNSKEAREKAVELLFEKYDTPGQHQSAPGSNRGQR